MAFNLKLVLKALLFSSSQSLTIKDIQTVFARYHEQTLLPGVAAGAPALEAEVSGGAEAEAGVAELGALTVLDTEVEEVVAPADDELYAEVPSLVTAAQIREAMEQLQTELKAANDIYLLVEGAQGYRLVTQPRFAKWIRTQRDEPPPVKLTPSALETLAVVAYRQPVTRSEIEAIRGVAVENVLNKLLERELIYVVGRADLPGRPIQYGTTDKFLEFVGVKSLIELPSSDVLSPRQIDEWLNRSVNVTPPADAEMGLPLEAGEGESPNFAPVEIAPTPAPLAADPAPAAE
ncbi:MAG: SMC-Scp complex subunit ScpB [Verrucomicrobia bacterium]|nr:SMC-Scp complex subunit ScpB [Verrucomicrobiota bacterium]